MEKSQRAQQGAEMGNTGIWNFCQAPGSLAQFFKQLWGQGCHTLLILLWGKVAGVFIPPHQSWVGVLPEPHVFLDSSATRTRYSSLSPALCLRDTVAGLGIESTQEPLYGEMAQG